MQAGNLLDLAPIDLSAASLPAVGVPPLDLPGLLGVQFLGFSVANFSSTTNADLSVSPIISLTRSLCACTRRQRVRTRSQPCSTYT